MSEPSLPGTALDLPLPPELTEAFGYRGGARYVAFSWWPGADTVAFDDGRGRGTGNGWCFLVFRRHPAAAALLEPFDLGSSDGDARHALVIDRQRNRASVAAVGEAQAFLRAQHPPQPELTAGQAEHLHRQAEQADALGWCEERVDDEAVRRSMQEQRGRLARMVSWLDQAPVPPSIRDKEH